MRILTDIDPSSPRCPEPSTSWMAWPEDPESVHVARAVFGRDARLFVADRDGAKLAREFPLVLWRERAAESQVDLAMRLAKRMPRAMDKLVLVADSGDGMKGHFDRSWKAESGNLHATVLVRENPPATLVGMGYAALPVVALAEATANLVGAARTGIRWINDILVDGAKVGGAVSRANSSGGYYHHAAFGMGLNTRTAPDVAPTIFVPRVGSLAAETAGKSPLELLTGLLSAFAANHALLLREGGGALVERYRRRARFVGRQVFLYEDGVGCDALPVDRQRLLTTGVVEEIDGNLFLRIGGRRFGAGRLVVAEA